MAIRRVKTTRLCSLAFLCLSAAVRADYSTPPLKVDTYATRRAERREALRKQQQELIAREDRLYNEITSRQAQRSVWQQYGWTVLTAVVLLLVFVRLLLDRQWRQLRARWAARAR